MMELEETFTYSYIPWTKVEAASNSEPQVQEHTAIARDCMDNVNQGI